MSLSVRTRFEVFKRDRFTCSYCGGHPPDVLLEVDHVHPKAAGGTDDMDNLVTACWDCNRGKSDRLLDEGGRPTVSPKTVAALEERLEQAKAYVQLLGQLSSVTEAMLNRVIEAWALAFDASTSEDGSEWILPKTGIDWPNMATVRVFLRDLPLDEILRAIDIAASKFGQERWKQGADRYFYAICWRRIRDKNTAEQPPDPRIEELEAAALEARLEVIRQLDVIAELREENRDLRVTVRRFREETGRE